MSDTTRSIADRRRRLMLRACELGARDFDAKENLVRMARSDVPAYGGCAVGHTSLEYAIALLETGNDAERARRIISRILDLQENDTRKVGHGNFPFMAHWTDVHDANAVCFLVPNLVYVWQRHRARLGAKLRARLQQSWPLCAHALFRHPVTRDYTNIYLLSLLSKFLLAPLLPRSDLDANARTLWRDWMYHTARYGIVEYNSPTYVPVCLYALERLWAFGPRDLREQFERVLEYFHFEFAARFHAPSGYLAGAMSRAYRNDMSVGRSYASVVAHLQYGTSCDPDSPIIVNWLLSKYAVPPSMRRVALRKSLPLEIRSDVEHIGISRTDYLARDFSIGSQTGRWCHPQEVPLFVTVRGEGPGRCLFVQPSFPQAARFVSRQRGAELFGLYWFDHVNTRYFYCKRNVKPMSNLPKNLGFDWQLGPRELVGGVWLNGRRWDGLRCEIRGGTPIVIKTGAALLGLRVDVTRSGHRMQLEWRDDSLVLSVVVSRNAMEHAKKETAGKMALYLCLANSAASGERSLTTTLRQTVLCNIESRIRGGQGTIPPAPTVHRSALAVIKPDDLLDFFQGRTRAPWSK